MSRFACRALKIIAFQPVIDSYGRVEFTKKEAEGGPKKDAH